ncbi:MAG: glycosyltransferase [Candidatus Competibacteraceae bacterium]
MSLPLISVVLTTYNRAGYLGEAVESVLSQSYSAIELIVVDDGSTDGTATVLAAYAARLQYFFQENRGCSAARNVGIAKASGNFLAFLDSDDIWVPHKLTLQMKTLGQAPEIEAVYGHAEQFVSPELDEKAKARLRHLAGRTLPAPLACSLLIRREAFERVGSWDESLRLGLEADWYARACEAGIKTVLLPDVLYRRRLHRSNLNLTFADDQVERLHVLKRMLDRRRNRQSDAARASSSPDPH